MSVAVVVPWRPTPDRAKVWGWLRPHWEALGWPVHAVENAGPWCKGLAVAAGVGLAAADTLVIADADVSCDGVVDAVAAVEAAARWAVPHTRILRLSKSATEIVMEQPQLWTALRSGTLSGWHQDVLLERPAHSAVPGGGITVLRSDVWDACPMPVMGRREDEIWGAELRRRYGRPWRGTADLYHLYHEPSELTE